MMKTMRRAERRKDSNPLTKVKRMKIFPFQRTSDPARQTQASDADGFRAHGFRAGGGESVRTESSRATAHGPFRRHYPNEFLFSAFALLCIVIFVQGLYATWIRPTANALLTDSRAEQKADPSFIPQRSLYVIVKDYEQESCLIMLLWAVSILAYKAVHLRREQRTLEVDLVQIPEGVKVLPADTREYARHIESFAQTSRGFLLPRALLVALNRFAATRNIQDAANASHAVCQTEADRLDSELSMLRYIAWAIPAIGFIGTVRGIGNALGQAQKAVTGDISGVTSGLGITFNSTLIALLFSIMVMFLLHAFQRTQERFVLDAEGYLDDRLIRHMYVS